MQGLKINSVLTQTLAIYAAVVSTVGLVLTLVRDLRDAPNVKVSAGWKRFVIAEDGKAYQVSHTMAVKGMTPGIFFVANAVNVGRRPTFITHFGGAYIEPTNSKQGFIIIPRDLPKMLKEGESLSEYTNEVMELANNIKSIYFLDSSDRRWKLPKRELKRIKGELTKILLE